MNSVNGPEKTNRASESLWHSFTNATETLQPDQYSTSVSFRLREAESSARSRGELMKQLPQLCARV